MMQAWYFISRIIETEKYASVPVVLWLNQDVIRIYYSSRDQNNCSIPYYIDFNVKKMCVERKPSKINVELGSLGSFDDSGIMPTSLIKPNPFSIYLYYIGWNTGKTVPFRNSIGLMESNDGGETFYKKYSGPIIDRTKDEPYFVASNHVLYHDSIYKMWYLSCVRWKKENNYLKHYYHIKYATSKDGIDWERNSIVAIDFKYKNEYAISVPRVFTEDGLFKMYYSYRGGPQSEKYRIGYAESIDGISWTRKDQEIIFHASDELWDEDMQCYPYVFKYEDSYYMLYNGNDYGKYGLGLAKLTKGDYL